MRKLLFILIFLILLSSISYSQDLVLPWLYIFGTITTDSLYSRAAKVETSLMIDGIIIADTTALTADSVAARVLIISDSARVEKTFLVKGKGTFNDSLVVIKGIRTEGTSRLKGEITAGATATPVIISTTGKITATDTIVTGSGLRIDNVKIRKNGTALEFLGATGGYRVNYDFYVTSDFPEIKFQDTTGTNYAWRIQAADEYFCVYNDTTGTYPLFIKTNGDIGIGTITQGAKVEINGDKSTDTLLIVRNDKIGRDSSFVVLPTGAISTTGTITSGNITITIDDPYIYFDPATASESEWWTGVNHDAVGDDNDNFEIRQSATPGTNVEFYIQPDGDGFITGDFTVTGDDLFMNTNTVGYILRADGTNYNPTAFTTSAHLAGFLSDEVGTDKVIFSTNPIFQTGITAQGATDASLAVVLEADQSADNADTWQILIADGDELAIQTYASGSYADALTIVGSTLASDFPGALTAGSMTSDAGVSGTTITASTGFALGDGDYLGITSNEIFTFNAAGTIVGTGITDFIIDNTGTDVNSPNLSLKGDDGGVEEEATLYLAQGADPYLRISVDNDNTSPVLTGVIDIHDQVISFVNDNSTDIGANGANRPKDIYLSGDIIVGDDLFASDGGVINFNSGDVTLTHSTNTLTLGGGNLALGANNLTLTGSIAATGSRVTKLWATAVEVTSAADLTIGGSQISSDALSDVTSIGMLDEAEELTATWTPSSDQGVNWGSSAKKFNLVYGDTAHFNHYGGNSDFTIGGAGENVTINGNVILDTLNIDGGKLIFSPTEDSLYAYKITTETEAYDATSWNGNNTIATKDAIRDKVETLMSSTKEVDLVAGAGLSGGANDCMPGSDADVTVTFDATELEALTWGGGSGASIIWGWNLTAGDPQITFGNGVVNVSSGALQVGGSGVYYAGGTDVPDGDVADDITLTNITQITTRPITSLTATNWRLFYSADGGVPIELALGADGTFLESNGASAAPAFRTLVAGDIPDLSGTYQPLDANLTSLAGQSHAVGDLIYATAAETYGKLADVAAGQPLLSGGVTTAPAYAGYTFNGTGAATYTFPGVTASLAPLTSPSFVTPVLGVATATSVHVTDDIAQSFKSEFNIDEQLGSYVHGIKIEHTRTADIQPATGGWFGGQFVLNAGTTAWNDIDKASYAIQGVIKGDQWATGSIDVQAGRFETQSSGTVTELVEMLLNTGTAAQNILALNTHIIPSHSMLSINVQSSQAVGDAIKYTTGAGSSIDTGIDFDGTTISTAEIVGSQGETWENVTTNGEWTTTGGINAAGQVYGFTEYDAICAGFDSPSEISPDTLWFAKNKHGTAITVDSIRVESDVDDQDFSIVYRSWAGGGSTLCDAVTASTDGTNMYYATETTISSATIAANYSIGVVKPSVAGTTVTLAIYYHYTKQSR